MEAPGAEMNMPSPPSDGGQVIGLGLAVAAAAAIAVAAVIVPSKLLLVVIMATASLLLLLAARRYVHSRPSTLPGDIRPDAVTRQRSSEAADSDGLRVARYMFYAGMLTIGQTAFRPLGGFTISDWLFLAALCAALATISLQKRRVRFNVPPVIVLGVVLYVGSGLVASFLADDPVLSVTLVARFAYLTLVWFWLGTLVLTTPRFLRVATALWVVSVAVDGVAAMLQARGLSVPFLGPIDAGRMSGWAETVNGLGGAAAIAMAPAFALIATAPRLRRKSVWIVALLLLVAAIVLSGSVTGMAAGVAATGVWVVVSYRGSRALVIALVALTIALAVAQIQGTTGLPTPVQRILSTTGQTDGGRYSTVASRVEGYRAAWQALGEGGWVGHGVLVGYYDSADARSVHNLILRAWYEAGWAGAVGMVCVLFGGLGYALRAARRANGGEMRLLAVGMFSALVAFMVFAMSNPLLSQRYGWVPLALAIACSSVSRETAPSLEPMAAGSAGATRLTRA
jgi:O-Antigen ligase